MCTLYERIIELCRQKGVSGSRMCLDLGLSKSTLSDIKNGRKKGISTATAQKIAAYFNVSLEYLLGEEALPQDGEIRKASDAEIQFALFGGNDAITEAMYEEVKQFAAFIRQREGYNG
jgi:transcriptional regulator with XRE-family HTH domain